jgi:hypothetical protein
LLTVSSEIDLKRKTGGTKDTADRWPFPQHHININPDIFTTSLTPSKATPIGKQNFGSNSENLTYLVFIGFESGREEIFSRINKYKEKTEDELLSTEAMEAHDNHLLMAFRSSSGALEFIDDFNQNQLFNKESELKIVLHAGTATITSSNQIQGYCVEELCEMGKQVGSGSVFASELFAALLALNVKSFHLQYAGVIKITDYDVRPFYNVDLL